ncbi:serine hydrolase [Martelella sp.]|uniref:serine hydrolase domain-containing protein n=1 Tax=Martelella sp. TaxID=1969699 RepID=UPI0025BBB88B|nr:serine hydrolase domain-containing protein [Martelella sp.]
MTASVSCDLLKRRSLPLLALLLLTFGGIKTAVAADACVQGVDRVLSMPAAQAASSKRLSEALASRLDAAVTKALHQTAAPGAIVGVRTPEGSWVEGFGISDPQSGAQMAPGMHTRIGSVTKTFTGTVILQLAEDGLLSLDDTIGAYVSGIPNGDEITLRQLANMTSGVASYTASERFVDLYLEDPNMFFSPEDLVAYAVENSPLFEPGSEYDYSNTNTILLGMVIEKVTGQPVETALRTMIFEPLGLENTSWPGRQTAIPAPYAQGITLQGYAATAEAPLNATNWNPASLWTAGEIISDVYDLLTYGRALATGHGLLDAKSQEQRLRSFQGPADYGLALRCTDGWVGHTGELPGYTTVVYYNTQTDTTVAIQTNSDIPSGDCGDAEVLPSNTHGIACSLPAMRIFNALAHLLGGTAAP